MADQRRVRDSGTMRQIPALPWILLFAFAIRAGVRWHSGSADFWINGYTFFFELARSIGEGHGLALADGTPTVFRVPFYPLFLAALTFGHQAFFPILIAQSLIGAATVWCAALIARELFGGTAAALAAVLTAFYPYYLVHDTALQETSLTTFLTALAVLLLMWVRRNGSLALAAAAGLVLGVTVLTRANLAPFAAVAPLWLIVPASPPTLSWRRRLSVCLLCGVAAMLTVTPWLIRAYHLTGTLTLTSQSGFFLWLGNNPYTFSHYPTESIDLSQRTALAALNPDEKAELNALKPNEAAVDHWFLLKGLEYMRQHSGQTLVAAIRKIAAGFCVLLSPRRGFWPDLIYLLSYGPIMVLGLWGMWAARRHWREHLIFYALFATFIAVTAVYFGHTSYRAYLDVYWIVFTAGAIQTWAGSAGPSGLAEAGA